MYARPTQRAPYICAQCLLKQQCRRLQSTSSSTPPPPPPSGAVRLTNRRLIALHGPEAPKFLQGLITNNVRTDSRAGFYAAFLTAPGKVLYDVFVYPTLGSQWHKEENKDEEPGFLIEVDAQEAVGLMKHIKKHKLRSRFRLKLVEQDELEVWNAWKEEDRWTAHSQGTASENGSLIGLTDCRAPGMGQRLVLPPSSQGGSGLPAKLELEEAPLSAYTIRRYTKGIPEGQKEIPRDDSLPMNHNIDIMGGIDFKKGCYLGQELTIRTHHTGVVRRRILPVNLYEHGQEAPEKLVYDASLSGDVSGKPPDDEATQLDIRRDDTRKRATGKLIAQIGNVGLGMCRLEQMSNLTVSGEGSSFSPDDKFVVEGKDGQGTVGLKAFVPDWLRGQIRGPKIQRRVE